MIDGYHEEGDTCPEPKCKGVLKFIRIAPCSCHISPPCSACTDAPLTCPECGWEAPEHEPEHKYVPAAPGLAMMVHRPRPLDGTKIDYRSKSHTGSSMIKEGVYPEGTTREEVQKVVDGTFGGRFTSFGNGRFQFIAYTD